MRKGLFIAFEGIDGSGKSTQIKLLAEYLRGKGIAVYTTGEPTDSPFGSLIHQCMTGRVETDDKTIAGMFVADRLDHILNKKNGMLEKINSGVTVITDRYYFSSYAYHGAYMPMDWVIEANRLSAELLRPDLNLFLDVDPMQSIRRLGSRGQLERYEKLEIVTKIREKYFEAFERLKDVEHIRVVESKPDKFSTHAEIKEIIDELFANTCNQ